jgi:uncharacterized protein YbcI
MADALKADAPEGQSMQMAVSNAMVKLYKELFGRGPTKARTNFAGPDVLVCTLQDSLTAPERNLVDMGQHQRLRDSRTFFQYSAETEFRDAVEQNTGRKVWAFVSGIDTARDVSSEVFYLEPESNGSGITT